MDARPVTDAELLDIARGMAYDTATVWEDLSRRLPMPIRVQVRNVAQVLKQTADDLLIHANPPTDPPTSG